MATTPEPVRIFVGTEPRMWRAEAVLRYSLEKHAIGPFEIIAMDHSRSEQWRGWRMGRPLGQPATCDRNEHGEPVWYTDFSCFRWSVPEVCGFRGKAIYVDVDVVFLQDPGELYELELPTGKGVLSHSAFETGVMVLDCAFFKGVEGWPCLEDMKRSGRGIPAYTGLLERADAFAELPPRWSCIDGEGGDGESLHSGAALIHYSDMSTQVWRPYPERFSYRRHSVPEAEEIWMELFNETFASGALPLEAPPGAELPEGVEDSFPTFAKEHSLERSHLAAMKSGANEITLGESRYTRTNPSRLYESTLELYRQLHLEGLPDGRLAAEETFSGMSLGPHVIATLRNLIVRSGARSLLDYGSGKARQYAMQMQDESGWELGSVREFLGLDEIVCFDPAYPPYSMRPSGSFDAVVANSVLEYCPEDDLEWILDDIFGQAKRFVFGWIHCHRSQESELEMAEFRVTVRPPSWWVALIRGVASRHPFLEYHFLFDLRFPSVEAGVGERRRIEIASGPPYQRRALS